MFRIRLTACLLIFSVLAGNMSRYFIYAGFELNKSYIARVLCINVDKPELKCNGKCFLTKKIKEADEKEKSAEQQMRKYHQDALIVNALKFKFHNYQAKARPVERSFDLPERSVAIFHPPQA